METTRCSAASGEKVVVSRYTVPLVKGMATWKQRKNYRTYLERGVVSRATQAGARGWLRPFALICSNRLMPAPTMILHNGIVIDSVAWPFSVGAQRTIEAIKREHPAIDVRLIFEGNGKRAKERGRGSRFADALEEQEERELSAHPYAEWCQKHGVQWAVDAVPPAWLTEEPNATRITAVNAAAWQARTPE